MKIRSCYLNHGEEFRNLHLTDPDVKSGWKGFIKEAGKKEARRNSKAIIEEGLIDLLNEDWYEEEDRNQAFDEWMMDQEAEINFSDQEEYHRFLELEAQGVEIDWYAYDNPGYAKWLERNELS